MKNLFESNAAKEQVRTAIIRQIKEKIQADIYPLLAGDPDPTLKIWTLPGETARFEEKLYELRQDFPSLTLNIAGFERDQEIFSTFDHPHFQMKPMLCDCGATNCPTLYGLYSEPKFEFQYMNDSFRDHKYADVIWADTCGFPYEDFVDKFCEELNSVESSGKLIYITHNLKLRKMHPRLRELREQNQDPTVTDSDLIIQMYREKINGAKSIVFKHEYYSIGEGHEKGSPMLTIGFEMVATSHLNLHWVEMPLENKASYRRLIPKRTYIKREAVTKKIGLDDQLKIKVAELSLAYGLRSPIIGWVIQEPTMKIAGAVAWQTKTGRITEGLSTRDFLRDFKRENTKLSVPEKTRLALAL